MEGRGYALYPVKIFEGKVSQQNTAVFAEGWCESVPREVQRRVRVSLWGGADPVPVRAAWRINKDKCCLWSWNKLGVERQEDGASGSGREAAQPGWCGAVQGTGHLSMSQHRDHLHQESTPASDSHTPTHKLPMKAENPFCKRSPLAVGWQDGALWAMTQPRLHRDWETGAGDSVLTNLSLPGEGCNNQTNLWHAPKMCSCSSTEVHAVGGLVTSAPASDGWRCWRKLRLSIAVILLNQPINARFM